MLKMRIYQRPWALFDPADKKHRAYFDKFLKTQSWKDCPVQWVIADDFSRDVVHHISKVLLEHYTSIEFKPKKKRIVAKKPQNLLKKVL
jgi:cytochrome c oxidase assembly protein Cox11